MSLSVESLQLYMSPLFAGTGGIDSWIHEDMSTHVANRIANLEFDPLTHVQLNQLLVLSHENGMSAAFFDRYWGAGENAFNYDAEYVPSVPASDGRIRSLAHLRAGFYRFYVDALLYFPTVRSAYRSLAPMSASALSRFFSLRRIDTSYLARRGKALPLEDIPRDDRYLVSEIACKAFEDEVFLTESLAPSMRTSFRAARSAGKQSTFRELLSSSAGDQSEQLAFGLDTILDVEPIDESDVEQRIATIAARFRAARAAALRNTSMYLSMVNEMDAYVATSMRTREDFRKVAAFCRDVFASESVEPFSLRYFDPTSSAAAGHEDKGLVECLMVKASKILIYHAGTRDSFGKDAEAAMALSQGKPVIFYCENEPRANFYRSVHPLVRLLEYSSGIVVGAMVVTDVSDVTCILERLLTNRMQYKISRDEGKNLTLTERISNSVVRLQTADSLLRETLDNYFADEP